MIIGGLVKFSLNDYPGKTSAVIFTQGCNFRCRYCHNPELVLPEKYGNQIPLAEVYSFLQSRKGQLDAVCVTGGEPTQHSDLPKVLKEIKEMGFLVKLDTNGSRPDMIEEMIKPARHASQGDAGGENIVDYIAMDIKTPFEDYKKITGVPIDTEKLKKSVNLIINSGLPHEFRTTIVKSLTSFDDLRKIAESIKGADNYFLQKFVSSKLNDPSLVNEVSYSEEELKELAAGLSIFVKHCGVR
jgi:pyruvate formate lyase activating enzyme